MADVPLDVEIGLDGDEGIEAVKSLNNELKETDGAQKNLAKSGKSWLGVKTKLLAVAVAIAAVDLGRRFLGHAKAMDMVANSMEFSTEKAQQYAIAAGRVNVTTAEIEEALKSLARNQGAKNNLFHTLGLSLDDIRKKHPAEIFDDIAKRIDEGKLTAIELKVAIELMGSTGENVARGMTKGFHAFAKEAKDSGQVISSDVIDPLAEGLNRSAVAVGSLSRAIKTELNPAAELFAETIGPALNSLQVGLAYIESKTPVISHFLTSLLKATPALLAGGDAKALGTAAGSSAEARSAYASTDERFLDALRRQEEESKKRRSSKGGISELDFQYQQGKGERVAQLAKIIGGQVGSPVGQLSSAGLFATPGATAAAGSQQRAVQLLNRISVNTRNTASAVESKL